MCKPHHSESPKGSKLVISKKTFEFPKNARINIQDMDLKFRWVFCKNARIAIVLKFKWRKRMQVYIYICVCVCVFVTPLYIYIRMWNLANSWLLHVQIVWISCYLLSHLEQLGWPYKILEVSTKPFRTPCITTSGGTTKQMTKSWLYVACQKWDVGDPWGPMGTMRLETRHLHRSRSSAQCCQSGWTMTRDGTLCVPNVLRTTSRRASGKCRGNLDAELLQLCFSQDKCVLFEQTPEMSCMDHLDSFGT